MMYLQLMYLLACSTCHCGTFALMQKRYIKQYLENRQMQKRWISFSVWSAFQLSVKTRPWLGTVWGTPAFVGFGLEVVDQVCEGG